MLSLILDICEKQQANASLSKRDCAALRKAGKRFEKITGLGLIFEFERIEVNASYDLIRLWKAIRNLPEFGHAGSGIHRLFAQMMKVFKLNKVSRPSARNYYNRKEDE